MRIKKFFIPSRSEGDKFLLKMQKQKFIVQAFYIALGIALLSAFVKLIAFFATPLDILAEELIIFIPLLYMAIRQVRSGLESAKHISVKDSSSVLVLLALIIGVLAAALCFGALFAYNCVSKAALQLGAAALIAAAMGVLTAVFFYIIIHIIISRDEKPTQQ